MLNFSALEKALLIFHPSGQDRTEKNLTFSARLEEIPSINKLYHTEQIMLHHLPSITYKNQLLERCPLYDSYLFFIDNHFMLLR
jgi:hypothetical protein